MGVVEENTAATAPVPVSDLGGTSKLSVKKLTSL